MQILPSKWYYMRIKISAVTSGRNNSIAEVQRWKHRSRCSMQKSLSWTQKKTLLRRNKEKSYSISAYSKKETNLVTRESTEVKAQ